MYDPLESTQWVISPGIRHGIGRISSRALRTEPTSLFRAGVSRSNMRPGQKNWQRGLDDRGYPVRVAVKCWGS